MADSTDSVKSTESANAAPLRCPICRGAWSNPWRCVDGHARTIKNGDSPHA